MNKTKRVAWHKHLKRARREKEKAQIAAHAQAQTHAGAPARGAVGAHTPPVATRSGTAARSTTSTTRQATPRP